VLQSSDIDPIYICTELFACPRNRCLHQGCTTISNVAVTPSSGPLGTVFNVTVTIVVGQNATGTGTTILEWKCPTSGETGVPLLNEGCILKLCEKDIVDVLLIGFRAGSTNHITYKIDTRQDACLYSPAVYQLVAASCAYDCTDKYGVVYSVSQQGQFTITQ
jgi:hypothetical protein